MYRWSIFDIDTLAEKCLNRPSGIILEFVSLSSSHKGNLLSFAIILDDE